MTVTYSAPSAEFTFEAIVDVGERRDLGDSPLGHRYLIDIVGGSFQGPRLQGKVLPGGADRQLWRKDGVRELDALYELQTDDGAIITVHNRVLIEDLPNNGRYARSVVKLTAPAGPHDWLNKRVFVGTLTPLMPTRQAVRIAVFMLV
jgi:Protein of unknown function (DUF3237)